MKQCSNAIQQACLRQDVKGAHGALTRVAIDLATKESPSLPSPSRPASSWSSELGDGAHSFPYPGARLHSQPRGPPGVAAAR